MSNSTIPGLNLNTSPAPGVSSQVVTVTPELAAEWLARNTKNRTISQRAVDQYAADMERDAWPFTGQPIIFDSAGALIDGQHRLTAQVKAAVTLPWLVITGAPSAVQDFVDIGRPRSVANQLQIKGKADSNSLAAVARLSLVLGGNRAPSKPQTLEDAQANIEEYSAAAHIGRRTAQLIRGSSAAYAIAFLHLRRIDETAAVEFFEALQTGANLPGDSPVLIARTYIAKNVSGKGLNDSARVAFINYLFKTWNLWREGKKVKSFSRPVGIVVPIDAPTTANVRKIGA